MCATDIDLSCPLASVVLRAEEHTREREVVPIPMVVIVCPLPDDSLSLVSMPQW